MHGEIRVLLDVINGMYPSGPITAIEIPLNSVSSPPVCQSRPPVSLITKRLREESQRLREAILEHSQFINRHIMPLTYAGWRVSRTREGWVVDCGISQVLDPVYIKSPPQCPAEIGKDGQIIFKDTRPNMILTISNGTLNVPVNFDAAEKTLFRTQLSQVSQILFSALVEEAQKRTDISLCLSGFLEYTIMSTDGKGRIDVKLRMAEEVNDLRSNPVCQALFKAFLEKKTFSELLDILLLST